MIGRWNNGKLEWKVNHLMEGDGMSRNIMEGGNVMALWITYEATRKGDVVCVNDWMES